MDERIVLTLDIDWAPDFMIDFVAECLVAHQVKATWFVTHASPAIQRLQQHPDLFELGIHPNFLPGSTHGDTPEAILRQCMDFLPFATSVRTHSLFQSSRLLELIMKITPVKIDTSLFLPYVPGIRPFEYHWHNRTLLRIPYYWDDDYHMDAPDALWDLSPLLGKGTGLKVFAFHPIHIFLNSADIRSYEALKNKISDLRQSSPDDFEPFVQSGYGTQVLFLELVRRLKDVPQTWTIRDIYQQWHAGEREQE